MHILDEIGEKSMHGLVLFKAQVEPRCCGLLAGGFNIIYFDGCMLKSFTIGLEIFCPHHDVVLPGHARGYSRGLPLARKGEGDLG